MYIERVPNRNSPPAILLRESYREGKKVRKRTLVNLSKWPKGLVEGLQVLLRGGAALDPEEGFEVVRTRPHGHVMAVLGTVRKIGLDRLLAAQSSPQRERVLAMICARILAPGSKLATARALREETLSSTLAEELRLGEVDEEDLYAAMDWLLHRQGAIETALAKRHLEDGTLVLYDLSSTYFEGRACPLAQLGYSRDGKKGTLQIVFGLLCDRRGCPVAVEAFEGSTADPKTVGSQIAKLRERFGLERVVLVGDRGMLTEARIREELRGQEGLEWITALRAPAIRSLVEQGNLQLSLLDQRDLATVTSPEYPGERLIVCKNPLLGEQRRRKREELLAATEQELEKIVAATRRPKRRLKGKEKIALRLGKVLNRFKMAKHFTFEIAEEGFTYQREEAAIAAEAALDGIYVVRTSVAESLLQEAPTVQAYKGLSKVERAFRSLKSVDLKIRPIYHHLADRVRAHVLLCVLAYYVEWHMRSALAPLLFDDEDPQGGERRRKSPVAPAQVSERAEHKAATKRSDDDQPIHSFHSLLADLATIAKNRIQVALPGTTTETRTFDRITRPTPLQQKALDLLGVHLQCTQ